MSYPIEISEEAGVRYLHFGTPWIQGAMRIARPWQLELDYTKEMMASLLLRDDAHFPRRVLLIGLGAASLTKFLYRHYPHTHQTVVEIEPAVVTAARQFFKLPDDPHRIRLIIGNGARFVAESSKQFDLIFVDGFDENARAGELDTLHFYEDCHRRLNDNGILAVNLLGRSRGYKASFERIRTAFDGRALAFPSCDSGNIIAFAARGKPIKIPLSEFKSEAVKLKHQTGLNLLPTISRIERAHTCKGGILSI